MARGLARDHDEKREKLRDGAARYFAAHGYDRASLTGAARSAGVSKALIYHYYDGKEALLYDILHTHLAELAEAAEAAQADGLPGLIGALLDGYEDADAAHKLQLEALEALPEDLQAPLLDLQRRLVRGMSDAVRAERPDLDQDTVRAATMSIFGILNWVYMWHRPGRGLSRTEYAEMAVRFVRGGLAAL